MSVSGARTHWIARWRDFGARPPPREPRDATTLQRPASTLPPMAGRVATGGREVGAVGATATGERRGHALTLIYASSRSWPGSPLRWILPPQPACAARRGCRNGTAAGQPRLPAACPPEHGHQRHVREDVPVAGRRAAAGAGVGLPRAERPAPAGAARRGLRADARGPGSRREVLGDRGAAEPRRHGQPLRRAAGRLAVRGHAAPAASRQEPALRAARGHLRRPAESGGARLRRQPDPAPPRLPGLRRVPEDAPRAAESAAGFGRGRPRSRRAGGAGRGRQRRPQVPPAAAGAAPEGRRGELRFDSCGPSDAASLT